MRSYAGGAGQVRTAPHGRVIRLFVGSAPAETCCCWTPPQDSIAGFARFDALSDRDLERTVSVAVASASGGTGRHTRPPSPQEALA